MVCTEEHKAPGMHSNRWAASLYQTHSLKETEICGLLGSGGINSAMCYMYMQLHI